MPSPFVRVSVPIRVAVCCVLAAFPLAGCGLFFHDDGVEQQTSKALSTFQSGGVTGIGANGLSGQAKADAAEFNADIALNQSMRRYDFARLLGDMGYIAAACPAARDSARKHRRPTVDQTSCPLLVFMAEVDLRRDALALNASHQYANWQLLMFTDQLPGVATGPANGPPPDMKDPVVQRVTNSYNAALTAYKQSGRTDFTSCQAFRDPHGPDDSPAEKMFLACAAYLQVINIPRPVDDVLKAVGAPGVTGRISDVQAARDQRTQDLKGLQDAENAEKSKLAEAQQDLAKAKATAGGADSDAVGKSLQHLVDLLNAADAGASAVGRPQDEPGAKLAAIKFRNANLKGALDATVSAAAPASGASATNATQGAGGSGGQKDLAIASIISGATTLAEGRIGPAAPSALLDLQAKTLAGEEAAFQGQIDAVKDEVAELDNQLQAYVTEFVLLNAADNALNDAQKALVPSDCRAVDVGEILQSGACAAGRGSLSQALTLYDRAWSEGRAPGNASEIRQAQLERLEGQSAQAAVLDARVAVDTEALTALASAGKSGIAPATIATIIQALATVVIAARVH